MDLLELVKAKFSTINSEKIDWGDHSSPGKYSLLDPKRTNLSEIFSRYFSAYADAADNATVTADLVEVDPTYEYQAVRTCVIDMLRFIEEKPLYPKAYDTLAGPPFWRR